MTVSVIIPSVPVRPQYLSEALDSVAKQTLKADEIIVINDHEGNGAAWARNKAMNMATSDFIAFLDDDDLMLPEHLEKLQIKQLDTGADVVYPAYETHPEGWRPIPDYMGRQWSATNRFIFCITTLVRREAALAVGGFENDPGATAVAGEDWMFWNKLVDAGYKFAHLPERTWLWRMHQTHHSGVNYKEHSHAVNADCGPR